MEKVAAASAAVEVAAAVSNVVSGRCGCGYGRGCGSAGCSGGGGWVDKDSAIFMYIIGVGAPGATHLECRTLMLVMRSFWHSQPRHVAPPSDGLPP